RRTVALRVPACDDARGTHRWAFFIREFEEEPLNVRGVRGAIVVPEDTTAELRAATSRLVSELLRRNQFETADIVSIIFTVTPDLHSGFPAEAARELGLTDVPLLCAQEIGVAGAMERVIRVLMHVNTAVAQTEVHHVYLDGAESLRDDLV